MTIIHINYEFTHNGVTYKGIGKDIGSTSPNASGVYTDDIKDCLGSAIFDAMPDWCETEDAEMLDALMDCDTLQEALALLQKHGFAFQYIAFQDLATTGQSDYFA